MPRPTSKDSADRSALVTGASSGIGHAFAHVLAEQGYDVIVTARRGDRLNALSQQLASRYKVRTLAIPLDLAAPDAIAQLIDRLARESWRVDLLVNNAGFGVPGSYVNTTWRQQAAFLQVLVSAVAELTHRLLPAMMERQWGRIINVASLAGLLPGVAGHTLYAASKAFVVTFSESLAQEVAHRGVHVTASCPGFTLSEFHDVIGTRARVNRLPDYMWLDAETVARESYRAVMRGQILYVPGRVNRSIAVLSRKVPRRLVVALMNRMSGSFRET